MDRTPRALKALDALSQFVNVTILPRHHETTANESISGRSYRMGWHRAVWLIDGLLGTGHCEDAHRRDLRRAIDLLNERDRA